MYTLGSNYNVEDMSLLTLMQSNGITKGNHAILLNWYNHSEGQINN
jgi:hypothetical protein